MEKSIITGVAATSIAIGTAWISPAWTADDARQSLPYTDAVRVAEGAALYTDYCASCHGANLEGQQPNWQDRDADGYLPAPPHDETGHTWHHDNDLLMRIVRDGTEAIVGGTYKSNMIGFGDVMSDNEIASVLGYIKSTWPTEIQNIHNEINARVLPQRVKWRPWLAAKRLLLATERSCRHGLRMRLTDYLRENAPFLTVGAMLTFLSASGQTYFISIFAGEIRVAFGLSHGAWGGIYMLGTMASAVVMIWAGSLTDRYRVRVLGPMVLTGMAITCGAMAFNQWVWALPVLIFALRFFGQGMMTHIAVVAMARWFVATRGKALSIASFGFAFGEAFLPMAVVAAMSMTAWQNLWLVAAGISLLSAPIIAWLLSQERTPASLANSESSVGMRGNHWMRSNALRHPLFWCMVPAIIGPSAFNTAFFFHQVHFAQVKGIEHLIFVSFFPIFTALTVIVMISAGWALDKYGTARLMPFFQVPMVFAFLTFALSQDTWSLALGFAFLGMTSGANATLPNAFWAEFYGTAHIGAIKAMVMAVMVLGSAIGPGMTGIMIDQGIGIETQFLGVALYFVGVTGLMMWGIGRAARDLPLAQISAEIKTPQQ